MSPCQGKPLGCKAAFAGRGQADGWRIFEHLGKTSPSKADSRGPGDNYWHGGHGLLGQQRYFSLETGPYSASLNAQYKRDIWVLVMILFMPPNLPQSHQDLLCPRPYLACQLGMTGMLASSIFVHCHVWGKPGDKHSAKQVRPLQTLLLLHLLESSR